MQHIEEIKNRAQKLLIIGKDQLTKNPLERALGEATSNENWNTPVRVSQEIADATYSYSDCSVVMKYIWKRLNSDTKEWRRLLKTLGLIEYLVKNGAPRCIGDFKDEMFKIRTFSDFVLVENGSDKGSAIRDKTKSLMDLLTNEKLIEEERENAKRIKDRLQQFGGHQSMSSDTSFKGYGSSSNTNTNTNKESSSNDYAKKYGVEQSNQSYQNDYNQSGNLDKYRGAKMETKEPTYNPTTTPTEAPIQEYKKPFQEPIRRLAKPGEDWTVPVQQTTVTTTTTNWSGQKPQQVQQVQQTSLLDFDDVQVPQPSPIEVQAPPPKTQDWSNFVQTPQQVQPQQVQQTPQINVFQQFQPFPQQPQQPQFQVQQTSTPQYEIPIIQQQPQTSQQTFQQTQQQQQSQFYGMYQQQPQQPQQPQQQQQPQQLQQQYQPQQPQQQQQQQQQQQYQPNQMNSFNQPQYNQTSQPSQNTYAQPNYYQQNPQQLNLNQQPQQYQAYQSTQQSKTMISPQKDEFQDFQQSSSTNKNKDVKSLEANFFNISDLQKEISEKKKVQPQQVPQYQQQVGQLYTTQNELDSFQLNYNKQQSAMYSQPPQNMNMQYGNYGTQQQQYPNYQNPSPYQYQGGQGTGR